MLPGSVFAALALIALVPGFAYLRLTEDARHPRQSSALDEFLEVAAAGLLSTGIAALFFVLCWPNELAAVISATADDPASVRKAAGTVAAVVGLSLGLAFLGAWITRLAGSGSYATDVWHGTLGRTRDEHVRHVSVQLKAGGRTVDGVLHAYTTVDGDQPRDIALKAPLTISDGQGREWDAGFDFVVIDASEINALWLKFQHDPPPERQGRRTRRRPTRAAAQPSSSEII